MQTIRTKAELVSFLRPLSAKRDLSKQEFDVALQAITDFLPVASGCAYPGVELSKDQNDLLQNYYEHVAKEEYQPALLALRFFLDTHRDCLSGCELSTLRITLYCANVERELADMERD